MFTPSNAYTFILNLYLYNRDYSLFSIKKRIERVQVFKLFAVTFHTVAKFSFPKKNGEILLTSALSVNEKLRSF